jgi:hypothetical protein
MTIRRWTLLGIVGLSIGIGLSTATGSAQVLEQLQEMLRPPPAPVQDEYRGRRGDEVGRGEEFRERKPGPPGGFQAERAQREELRERMLELREACQDGDRRACIRFGIIIGENRERRAQWRRENPDLFWWER